MNLPPDYDEQNKQDSRFRILTTEHNGSCATYELIDEDHTLGNALRHMILKNPNVQFCGYTLPHPNERKIHFQIQTNKGEALAALQNGFKDLLELNKVVRETIQKAYEDFGHVELVDSEDEDTERIEALIKKTASS